ncbi:MAG: hypothetical protein MMC23_003619 [Stictis urceolatum]|nr:hypothetical protein [Stictis urceolata]
MKVYHIAAEADLTDGSFQALDDYISESLSEDGSSRAPDANSSEILSENDSFQEADDHISEYLSELGNSSGQGEGGRPTKRRKLSPKLADPMQEDPWNDCLVLASMDINLKSSNTVNEPLPRLRDRLHAREVDLVFQRSRQDHFGDSYDDLRTCKLCSVGHESLGEFQLSANFPKETRRILAQALRVKDSFNKTKLAKTEFMLRQTSNCDDNLGYRLEVQILWRNSLNLGDYSTDKGTNRLLEMLYPDPKTMSSDSWSPRDFYDSTYVPDKTGPLAAAAASLKVDGLSCALYPFQKRSTAWMLRREGVDLDGKKSKQADLADHHGFNTITALDGRDIYVNCWLGMATTHKIVVSGSHTQVRGGLLAEEMGLGKTVEIVSLLLLHQRHNSPVRSETDGTLIRSNATLIVSPVSIQQQWYEEIQAHAPGLQVMIYNGVKSMKKYSEEDMVNVLTGCDVVLCSYDVLSREIHYATAEPERRLRHKKQYKKRSSPLVQIDWWRCVLDECQMVESGVSQAARVVNQIPRQNAWAVSGTPLRKDAKDLLGLLVFLRIQPYYYSQPLFQRLISSFKPIFGSLFSRIALRHSKEHIKSELELPRQNRVVMGMPFTQIEEQHYANLYQEMCDECGLSLEGAPLKGEWNPNDTRVIEKMRIWLARLRQSVLHPEVGEVNRRALGQSEGPLRTVAEVLKVMTEQNEMNMRTEERTWLLSKLKRGQILEHAKKPHEALEIWKSVVEKSYASVKECREQLRDEESQQKKAMSKVPPDGNMDDDFEKKTQTGLGTLRMRLRSALEVAHIATFFVSNAYYQLKTDEDFVKPDSDRFNLLEKIEAEGYEKAKAMRKEILSESLARANAFMNKVRARNFVQIPNFKQIPSTGIESRKVTEKVDNLIAIMDMQAGKIDEWREELIKLLLVPLIDQEESELQGDEYETSTKQQDEQSVYYEAVRALVADRSDHLTGQENGLIKRDIGIALGQARSAEGPSPESMVKLLAERSELIPGNRLGYVRGFILELRGLGADLERYQNSRISNELAIINSALTTLREDLAKQSKVVTDLEKEVDLFRDTMNARLEFYRQLQAISDMVTPYEQDLDEVAMQQQLARLEAEEVKLQTKINNLKSRGRYLHHLKEESNEEEGPRKCIICQDNIEVGVLISCGHQFCKDCLREWYNTHRTCPVCKKKLSKTDFHQITYKPQELTAQEEDNIRISGQDAKETDGQLLEDASLYSGINSKTLAEIKNVDILGSFGTKIDTLARHIIWLRSSDPGAKSIIFSQFRDFLDILARAFRRFKIGFATIDDKKQGIERFKKDSSVECFFLHAKAHASGLNLVNATHVFLCEPLINTALELQAIARVHRIGQHSQTNVYMYLVEDTIEKAIYDISVERRMAHINRVQEDSPQKMKTKRIAEEEIEKANSMEMQDASVVRMLTSGRGGGEMVDSKDLWGCLFGVKASGRAKLSDNAQKTLAGFLGAEAAEHRALVQRSGLA